MVITMTSDDFMNILLFLGYNDHGDVVQSLSWKQDGQLLVTSCKDKQLRVIDPRCNSANGAVTHSCISHHGIKDSRVVWLGNMNRILTTGFNSVSIVLRVFWLISIIRVNRTCRNQYALSFDVLHWMSISASK